MYYNFLRVAHLVLVSNEVSPGDEGYDVRFVLLTAYSISCMGSFASAKHSISIRALIFFVQTRYMIAARCGWEPDGWWILFCQRVSRQSKVLVQAGLK